MRIFWTLKVKAGEPFVNRCALLVVSALLLSSHTLEGQEKHIEWISGGSGSMADFSPDSRAVIAHGLGSSLVVWSTSTGERVTTIFDHDTYSGWQPYAYSANCEYIAVKDSNTIVLRSAKDFSVLETLVGHFRSVTTLSFSPDNRLLASGDIDGGLMLWSVENAHLLQEFHGHKQRINNVLFSLDCRFLISCSYDGTKVWDLQTMKLSHSYHEPVAKLAPLQSFGDTSALVLDQGTSSSRIGLTGIKIVDIRTGKVMRNYSFTMEKRIDSYAISRSGHYLVYGSQNGIWIDDFRSGNRLTALDEYGRMRSSIPIIISSDDKLIIAPYDFYNVGIWNVPNATLEHIIKIDYLGHIALSADGKELLSSSEGVKLWDVSTGNFIREYSSHYERVSAIAASPDMKWLASGGFDGAIHLYDQPTGKVKWSFKSTGYKVKAVAFSLDSRQLATASEKEHYTLPGDDYEGSGADDLDISIRDVNSGNPLHKLSVPAELVRSIFFTEDGQYLCYCSDPGRVFHVWDIQGDSLYQEYKLNENSCGYLDAVLYQPDRTLAASSNQYTIEVWDMEADSLIWRNPHAHQGYAGALIFIDNGRKLLSLGQDDGQIKIWSVDDGRLIQTIQTHKIQGQHTEPHSSSVSPDSKKFVFCGWNYLQFADLEDGKMLGVYEDYHMLQNVVTWAPDQQHVFSGSFDGSIISWRPPAQK